MKSKWVIHKLNSHIPSWATSATSPFKTLIQHTLKTLSFVLNHVDMSHLLSICGREGYFHLGSSLHASIIKTHESFNPRNQNALVIWNSLLFMYAKNGVLTDAVKLFDEMPMRDTVSWNTMISGFFKDGNLDMGFRFLKLMKRMNFYRLDQATLTTILSASDGAEFSCVNKMIHCLVFLNGFEREISVGNALITSYFKCGCSGSARQVFDEMLECNIITWTAMISGLAQCELYEDSLRLFVKMTHGFVEPNSLTYLSSLMACSGLQALREGQQIHGRLWKLGMQSDLCTESALMDMYSKCGSMDDALLIFYSAIELDEVSMTVILVGFAQNGFEEEAMQIFVKMARAGIEIDPNMVSAVLGVFGVDTSLGFGQQIHSLVIKRSFGSNLFVGNGLINMYSKCGDLEEAIKVFSRMPCRNSVSWNSMIAAFARHGDGSRVLHLYEEMRLEDVEPTDVTFVSLLHACSHAGLVEKGMDFLISMTDVHRIIPRTEHYACVIDMLGRAGLLNEAKTFVERLPMKPDALVWQALLGACGIHRDPVMGKYAAEQLLLSAPEKLPYVLLANIYSSKGRWKERAETIKRMKEIGVVKETGISWIEVENEVHSFVVEDRMHPQAEMIYGVLAKLFGPMVDEGYAPDKRFVRFYMNEDGKG